MAQQQLINESLLEYIRNEFDHPSTIITYLIGIRHDLDIDILVSDDDFARLIRDKIVAKDYVNGGFKLKVAFYKSDEGTAIESSPSIRQVVNERIDEFRKMFHGIRVGAMAKKQDCTDEMVKFMYTHGMVDFDTILAATAYYLEHTDRQYVNNADSFIEKKLPIVIEDYILFESSGSNVL